MRDQQPAQHQPVANDIETMLSSYIGNFCAESLPSSLEIPRVSNSGTWAREGWMGVATSIFDLSNRPLLIMLLPWIQCPTYLHDYSSTAVTVLFVPLSKPMQITIEVRDIRISLRHSSY